MTFKILHHLVVLLENTGISAQWLNNNKKHISTEEPFLITFSCCCTISLLFLKYLLTAEMPWVLSACLSVSPRCLSLSLFFSLCHTSNLWDFSSLTRNWTRAVEVTVPSSACWLLGDSHDRLSFWCARILSYKRTDTMIGNKFILENFYSHTNYSNLCLILAIKIIKLI